MFAFVYGECLQFSSKPRTATSLPTFIFKPQQQVKLEAIRKIAHWKPGLFHPCLLPRTFGTTWITVIKYTAVPGTKSSYTPYPCICILSKNVLHKTIKWQEMEKNLRAHLVQTPHFTHEGKKAQV